MHRSLSNANTLQVQQHKKNLQDLQLMDKLEASRRELGKDEMGRKNGHFAKGLLLYLLEADEN